jgi:hypothetical protein
MTLTTRIADFDCFCGADCGGWIKEGTPYAKISAGGSWPTVYLHPGCVDDFKAKLVRKLKPAQNVPRPAPVLVERECQRCGADYAGQAGDVVDRCRGCDGPLVDVDADDREAEVTTVECAECEWPMRVRGYLEPREGAPAWLRAAYERYRPVCADCADGVTAAASSSAPGQTVAPAASGGGSAGRARSSGASRLHTPGPQQALDGVEPSSSESPSSRDARS